MMKQFFDAIRPLFGGKLTQAQVDGMQALLDAGRGLSIPHMAHVLAEVKRETGGGMYPIKETVMPWHKNKNPSDREVIRRLDAAWAKGQLPWVKSPYWRGGWFGRGQIQITHEDNYRRSSAIAGVDLVAHPERALELAVSARIAVNGCASGLFRSHRLRDYDGEFYDHFNAREIVNGDKSKRDNGSKFSVGEMIAADGRAFEAALASAGWGTAAPPADYVAVAKASSFWADLIRAIMGVFK